MRKSRDDSRSLLGRHVGKIDDFRNSRGGSSSCGTAGLGASAGRKLGAGPWRARRRCACGLSCAARCRLFRSLVSQYPVLCVLLSGFRSTGLVAGQKLFSSLAEYEYPRDASNERRDNLDNSQVVSNRVKLAGLSPADEGRSVCLFNSLHLERFSPR